MSETQLIKQFSQQDVQRLRNLITKKQGEKTKTQIGYTKKKENYIEGDIWEEDGRVWTIKNGIKQNITKQDKLKEIGLVPMFCPKCNHVMKNRHDKSFYPIHKMCFNCVIDFEYKLRQEGKWEEHLLNIHNSQIDGMIEEFKNFMEEEFKESNNSYITEAGHIEDWLGDNKEQIKLEVNKAIKYLESLKKTHL